MSVRLFGRTLSSCYSSTLLFLSAENSVDRGATDRTGTSQGGFAVFCCHPLWVFHLGLLFAFHTIVQIGHGHCLLRLVKTYIPRVGVHCTRQVYLVSQGLRAMLSAQRAGEFSERRGERWTTTRKPYYPRASAEQILSRLINGGIPFQNAAFQAIMQVFQ